jgi:hypothetical protein
MTISNEIITIAGAILALIIGISITFGHRYSDRYLKLSEKSAIDELNEIRIAIRSKSIIPVINKLWIFLFITDQKMKKERILKNEDMLDTDSLFYDVARRDYFNKLINDIESKFIESMNVKVIWERLRTQCKGFKRLLYEFASFLGLIGYPLLILSLPSSTYIAESVLNLLWFLYLTAGIFFLVMIASAWYNLDAIFQQYDDMKNTYLLDEVKIRK